MIRVILLIDCASEYDRKLLRGMIKYSKENGPWLFYRMPSNLRWGTDREAWILDWARQWQADAIIGRWNDEKVELLSHLNIPIVLQNNRSRSETYSNLTGDYEGTGQLAASFFHKKLYTNYAFFGIKTVIWSEERGTGFRKEVERIGGRFFSLEVDPARESDMREEVGAWLHSLPKPVALFCCDDAHALFITETCSLENIQIPSEISLLGVDNDELFCGISDPPISSIELDVERGGYMTCKLLHRMITEGVKEPFNVVINPIRIKQRQSTERHNITDPYVSKVVRFIDDNYSRDLSIDSILEVVPLSRRSVEMRFKKVMGTTIYQYLISCRIELLAQLLTTTDRPLLDLAYEVGFKDGSNISRIFKKYKGCPPLEYRQKYCAF